MRKEIIDDKWEAVIDKWKAETLGIKEEAEKEFGYMEGDEEELSEEEIATVDKSETDANTIKEVVEKESDKEELFLDSRNLSKECFQVIELAEPILVYKNKRDKDKKSKNRTERSTSSCSFLTSSNTSYTNSTSRCRYPQFIRAFTEKETSK
ncbi:unnamed protein product [Lepeophtheirus salmonis]|uniref:(salmon louse) hypothetical protein n=1 Tax=Lepeophtheirus salmonis TaxID=72036 RepID=A0A7R8CUF6_LEPSM|nr:unnamed protein product [Lepeophtheirus salmonis]CAF2934611.1 unnamed protein product [Lepeophtheirus salmonis]